MKNKKLFTRTLTLLLALVMLLCCFVGCKKKDEGAGEGAGETSDTTVSTTPGPVDDGAVRDDLPDDLDYNGAEITVYGWKHSEGISEFNVTEINGLPIDEAIFKKDATVNERLNVKLKYELFPNQDSGAYPATIANALAGGDAYDIYGGHTRMIALATAQGLFLDLGNIEGSYLNFEKPYWNQSIIEKTTIGNSFFMCTGDITPTISQMIYCIYFNEDMINDLALESPYDLVANNQWTIDKMLEMNINFYEDSNENNLVDIGDKLPLVGANWDWPALLHGCGFGIVDRDVTGDLVLNSDFVGEKSIDIMKKLSDATQLDGAYCNSSDVDTRNSFMSKNSLFLITQSGLAAAKFQDITFQYGCVPCPKYDSEQENYISTARQPVTMFALSKAVKADRLVMITAVMECMASEGYKQVTPVVFGQVMQYQKAASAEMSEMLGLIRDTAWFDFGRIFSSELSYISDQPGMKLQSNTGWATYVSGTVNTTVKNQLKNLSDDLLDMAS